MEPISTQLSNSSSGSGDSSRNFGSSGPQSQNTDLYINQDKSVEIGDWDMDQEEDILMSHKKMKQKEQKKLHEIRMKSFGGPKGKLTSSNDILNRLKWDSQYPFDQFVIGYLDRFSGMMETTVEGYMDSEDVDRFPLHRIYYFKLNGEIVWERDSKLDLISTGEALKYVIHENNEESRNQGNMNNNEILVDSNNKMQNSIREEHSQNLPPHQPIIFSNKRNRAYYQDYIPDDTLEAYIHKVSNRSLALRKPTHVSQKGGYYHVPTSEYENILHKWSKSIERKEQFFMEENRSDIFRLYIDIDFKTTDGTKVDLIALGYLPTIQQYTESFFKKKIPSKFHHLINTEVLVTECHGPWTDNITQDANYKSGYRLYFPTLFVDEPTFSKYSTKLASKFEDEVKRYHEYQPEVWTWEDVIDVKQVTHKRGRMFGTCKWRRGQVLGREYKLTGYYNRDSTMNNEMTDFLRIQLPTLLQLTTLRLEENIHLSVSQDVKILIVTKNETSEEVYPIFYLNTRLFECVHLTNSKV